MVAENARSLWKQPGRALSWTLVLLFSKMLCAPALAQEASWIDAMCGNVDPVSLSVKEDLRKYAESHKWTQLHNNFCESDTRLPPTLPPNVLVATTLEALDMETLRVRLSAFITGNSSVRNASLVAYPVFFYARMPGALTIEHPRIGSIRDSPTTEELFSIVNRLRNGLSFARPEFSGLRPLAQALGSGEIDVVALSAEHDRNIVESFRRIYGEVGGKRGGTIDSAGHLELQPVTGVPHALNAAGSFLVLRSEEAFVGADSPDEVGRTAGGVAALMRRVTTLEPDPPSGWMAWLGSKIMPTVQAAGPQSFQYPLLVASAGSTAFNQGLDEYLARAYVRAVTRNSVGPGHPCERTELMPLVLAYLTAALDEQPDDARLREALRAYQFLNNTTANPPSTERLSVAGTNLVDELRRLSGSDRCEIHVAPQFRHRLEPGMAEYQQAVSHLREALGDGPTADVELRRGAACLAGVVTQVQTAEPSCRRFDRAMWFSYYEPFLPIVATLSNRPNSR